MLLYVHRNRRLIRDGIPVNMVLNVHTETIRLITDGEKGVWRWG